MGCHWSTHQFCLVLLLLFFSSSFFSSVDALQYSSPLTCNIYQGNWIYDDSYPISNSNCPFLDGLDCQKYGRPDKAYLKYRWKPQGCDIPRFDGLDFLRRWKGKKIMFVGDSLSLDMWVSFSCMLYASTPNTTSYFTKQEPYRNVTFEEYGVTVILYHTLFLVDMVDGGGMGKVLKLDSIESGKSWLEADLLIFNTGHWWYHRGSSQPWTLIQEGSVTYHDMDRNLALFKGLSTWAKWVDSNIPQTTGRVFYQGPSPAHFNGLEWGGPKGSSCKEQTAPLKVSRYPADPPPELATVKAVLASMARPVELLDITSLSQLRIDGHPGTYSAFSKFTDCSHWCVPGVPDTWNHLLYVSLLPPSWIPSPSATSPSIKISKATMTQFSNFSCCWVITLALLMFTHVLFYEVTDLNART